MPQRIVSLVPSQTELLYTLGVDVAGITKFCVHPNEWFRAKTRVGGTKNVNIAVVDQIKPDLIIANKEENVKEQVEELATRYPVLVTDVNTLDDAYDMIEHIGALTGAESQASTLITQIRSAFATLQPISPIPTAYLIWRSPYMTIGHDTFIHDMLQRCGFINIFAHTTRYPAINIDDLKNCQLLLLSSEPYPFKQQHIDELQSHLPNTKILLVDGELFSWYGSRLLHAPAYFQQLINFVINGITHRNR